MTSKSMPLTREGDQTARKRGKVGLLLRLSISLALLAVVFLFVDFDQLFEVLIDVNPWYLVAAVGLLYVDRVLMGYKWNLLLAVANVSVPLGVVVRIYLVSPIAQIFLPSTIGADLFRIYSLSRYKVDNGAVLASMVVERLTGLIATVFLVLISMIVVFFALRDMWSSIIPPVWIIVASAVFVGLAVLTSVVLIRLFRTPLSHRADGTSLVARALKKLHHVLSIALEYRKYPRTVSVVFGWTFLEQLLLLVLVLLIARALHIDVSPIQLFAIVPLTILAIRLPISLDGIGIQEGLYVALFALAGVSASEALLLSITRRAVVIFTTLPWGIYYITREKHGVGS